MEFIGAGAGSGASADDQSAASSSAAASDSGSGQGAGAGAGGNANSGAGASANGATFYSPVNQRVVAATSAYDCCAQAMQDSNSLFFFYTSSKWSRYEAHLFQAHMANDLHFEQIPVHILVLQLLARNRMDLKDLAAIQVPVLLPRTTTVL